MSAREWVPRGTVSGPTRRSAPTDSIEMSITPKTTGGDRARPLQKDGEYAEGWGDERTQGRFDIYRAVIGLVSRKAECPE